MKKRKMDYNRVRNIIRVFLFASIALCIASLIMSTDGSIIATYLILAAIACMTVSLILMLTGLKCPHCGTRVIRNCLKATVCPFCHHDLMTGEKVKGKKSGK